MTPKNEGQVIIGEEGPKTVVPVKREVVQIPPPNFAVAEYLIEGTEPYVQHKFSEKARKQIETTQRAGQQAKKGKKREPRDFEADYQAAMYLGDGEWHGIPASAFRAGAISACRLVRFKMTITKLTLFILADGYDGSTPLIRILHGKPQPTEPMPVRNDNGSVDLRVRPMWQPGWRAKVRIRYDRDQFSLSDVTNLLARVGLQVGIGEGRPDSKNSAGMGWGLFRIVGEDEG